jgi:hypothetical protein
MHSMLTKFTSDDDGISGAQSGGKRIIGQVHALTKTLYNKLQCPALEVCGHKYFT